MINYLLRLLKIALVTTLGVGGGAGLLVFVVILTSKGDHQHASQFGLIAGTLIGLGCTAIILCVLMPLDLVFRWSIARTSKTNETNTILENEQIRELTLSGPTKKVHFACRQALLSIPGIKNVYDDPAKGKIIASTSASWRCPGEQIEVEIKRSGGDQYLLHCVSRPVMKNVVFDYGKNFENVEAWKKLAQDFMKMGGTF